MLGLVIFLAAAAVILIALMTAMLAWEMRHPPRHTAAYAVARGMPCDPSELNPPLPYEEWWLDRPDGTRLPMWDIRVEAGEHGLPLPLTLVFIHGWGRSRIDLLPRIASFVPHCRRIIAYDLRGHGEAMNSTSRLGHREDEDLLAMLERLGEMRLVLIGHSMGAVIALNAAAKVVHRNDPLAKRIAGVVAYGPYCEFHPSLRGRLAFNGYPTRPVTDLALLLHRASGVQPLAVNEETASNVKCPLLVIHGSNDSISPLEHARRIVQAAANAQLHEVDGGAHVDAHLIDTDGHDRVIADFLRSLAMDSDEFGNQEASAPAAIRA